MKYKSLDKNAISVMRVNAFLILILNLIIFVIFRGINLDNITENVITFILIGTAFYSLLNLILFPRIRYERYKYYISEDIIDVKKGLFVITRTVIPTSRVQKIEVSNGPIDRYFSLSNVIIYTAAGITEIKFLSEKEANKITESINLILKEKLNEIC